MKRPALHNKLVGVLRMAFRARKVFGTFEKRAPEHYFPFMSPKQHWMGGWGVQKNPEYVIKSDLKDKMLYCPN